MVEQAAPQHRSIGVLGYLMPPATMLTILALSLLMLLTPLWTHWAVGASGGSLRYGTPDQVLAVSDQTVTELLAGPGTFQIVRPCDDLSSCAFSSVYTLDEIAHLRDVRLVLWAFVGLALASVILVGAALIRHPRDAARWRAITRGGGVLTVLIVVLGVVGALAFEPAFELFHRLLFPGGNWAFPADSNLIRLYPYAFWQLSAAAFGLLGGLGGAIVWFLGRRRAASLGARQ